MNRLIYIGNFRPEHSTENHVLTSLRWLGADVLPVQEDECPWGDLVDIAEGYHADFVLWTHTHDYASGDKEAECFRAIDALREARMPTVSYHLDRWLGLERQSQAENEPFFRTDLVVTADGGHDALWEQLGVNHRWLPPGIVHTQVGRGVRDSRYVKDVGFVGGWQAYGHAEVWPWRFTVVNETRLRYGSRFRAWPRGGPAIRGAELASIYASTKVLLGDSCLAPAADGTPMTRYWSDRVPETLGRAGLLVHPDVVGLRDWWPCALPFTFELGDLDSVFAAIERGLRLPQQRRDELLDEALNVVHRDHTYAVRMMQVFEWVDELRSTQ